MIARAPGAGPAPSIAAENEVHRRPFLGQYSQSLTAVTSRRPRQPSLYIIPSRPQPGGRPTRPTAARVAIASCRERLEGVVAGTERRRGGARETSGHGGAEEPRTQPAIPERSGHQIIRPMNRPICFFPRRWDSRRVVRERR